MVYNRWNNRSVWYCLWANRGLSTQFKLPTKKLKDKQLFEIYDSPRYFISYGEIKEKGLGHVLDDVRSYYKHKKPNEEQLMEIMGYINKFVDDVDKHFKPINFYKIEWLYPIKHFFNIYKK